MKQNPHFPQGSHGEKKCLLINSKVSKLANTLLVFNNSSDVMTSL